MIPAPDPASVALRVLRLHIGLTVWDREQTTYDDAKVKEKQRLGAALHKIFNIPCKQGAIGAGTPSGRKAAGRKIQKVQAASRTRQILGKPGGFTSDIITKVVEKNINHVGKPGVDVIALGKSTLRSFQGPRV